MGIPRSTHHYKSWYYFSGDSDSCCDSLICTTHDQYIRGLYLAMNIIKMHTDVHTHQLMWTSHFVWVVCSHTYSLLVIWRVFTPENLQWGTVCIHVLYRVPDSSSLSSSLREGRLAREGTPFRWPLGGSSEVLQVPPQEDHWPDQTNLWRAVYHSSTGGGLPQFETTGTCH